MVGTQRSHEDQCGASINLPSGTPGTRAGSLRYALAHSHTTRWQEAQGSDSTVSLVAMVWRSASWLRQKKAAWPWRGD